MHPCPNMGDSSANDTPCPLVDLPTQRTDPRAPKTWRTREIGGWVVPHADHGKAAEVGMDLTFSCNVTLSVEAGYQRPVRGSTNVASSLSTYYTVINLEGLYAVKKQLRGLDGKYES